MNKVILMGRLTRDVELKYTNGKEPVAIGKFSLAVSRRFKKEGEPDADFINCVAFGKTAEFISKYFTKGKMIAIVGRIQTGSYTNQNGQKVYTTDVLVEEANFCGEKKSENDEDSDYYSTDNDINDEDMPF
ncbi:MAG: single-stranded DNA-binding protein [Eubacteriales bacterium]|nr:single-stranded DNA-binding protein [Eubacteriales bacterium]